MSLSGMMSGLWRRRWCMLPQDSSNAVDLAWKLSADRSHSWIAIVKPFLRLVLASTATPLVLPFVQSCLLVQNVSIIACGLVIFMHQI